MPIKIGTWLAVARAPVEEVLGVLGVLLELELAEWVRREPGPVYRR